MPGLFHDKINSWVSEMFCQRYQFSAVMEQRLSNPERWIDVASDNGVHVNILEWKNVTLDFIEIPGINRMSM